MSFIKQTRDLTQGPIAPNIIAFAIPLLLASLIQQLYATVDLLFCGNVLGTDATAALGISALLVTCLISFMNGLSTGVSVVVAQLYGNKDYAGLRSAVVTALAFGVLVGGVLAIAGSFFAPTFVCLMDTPPSAIADARAYLQVYLVAMLAVMLYNLAAGVCRALGDSITPLLAQLVGGLLNIAANWFALCVLELGVVGIAFATLISNSVAAGMTLVVLCCRRTPAGLVLATSPLSWPLLKQILIVGLPISAQMVAISLSNVFVQYKVDELGVDAIAAFAIYLRVELVIYYGIVAVGHTTTTFVAQNHGAHDHARSARGASVCQLLALAYAAITSVLMLVLGYWAFWIFDHNAAVIACGQRLIAVTFPFYFLYAVLEVQGDVARGYGNSFVPALIVLVGICGLRIGLLFALTAQSASLELVAVTYPITWAFTALSLTIYRIHLERRYGHWR